MKKKQKITAEELRKKYQNEIAQHEEAMLHNFDKQYETLEKARDKKLRAIKMLKTKKLTYGELYDQDELARAELKRLLSTLNT